MKRIKVFRGDNRIGGDLPVRLYWLIEDTDSIFWTLDTDGDVSHWDNRKYRWEEMVVEYEVTPNNNFTINPPKENE